jgi:hypothetical protein
MAEIKSTLDLVMERTRHLTLSEEERREQALAEYKKSLGGIIQRFQDGLLTPNSFRGELRRLQESSQVTDIGLIFGEIGKRLDLDGDNAWALDLLAGAIGAQRDGIAAVLGEYREVLEGLAGNRSDEARRGLEKQWGISGTAVLPNLAADPGWVAEQQRLRERFKALVEQELSKLKPALRS